MQIHSLKTFKKCLAAVAALAAGTTIAVTPTLAADYEYQLTI